MPTIPGTILATIGDEELSARSLPAEYERLIDECCKVAGLGDWWWNERFMSALDRRGLTLATARHPLDRDEWYPGGHPMQSPVPYQPGCHAWPVGSLVVWKPIAALLKAKGWTVESV